MNKIFKVIFNHTTQTWMAVSELAKGHCKSSSNSAVEVSDKSEIIRGKSFVGIKTIAITSAMMMAAIVPNAFAVKADAGGNTGSVRWKTGEGTAIAGGNANGDTNAIAIGRNNDRGGEHEAQAFAPGAIAIGTGAKVGNQGKDENARGGIALGYNASSQGVSAISIGDSSSVTSAAGTAVGMHTTAGTGVAIGQYASASNARTDKASVAVGANATANGELTIAIGTKATASSGETVALGTNATAGAQYQNHATAIGANSKAVHQGGVALGYYSETERAGTSTNFIVKNDTGSDVKSDNFAGAAKTGDPSDSNDITRVVSVGNATIKRQIINVAAGRVSEGSTDAINGSQLYQAMKHTGFNIQQNGNTKSRINNDGLVNFANGSYTTAEVTDGDNSSSVKMNVVTQNISTNAQGVTSVSGTEGLTTAKTVSDAINNALNRSGFSLKANGESGEGEKITRNGSINIAQGKNINVTRNGSTITVKTVDSPSFTDVTASGSLTVSGTSNLRGDVLLGGEGKNITFQGKSNVDMSGNKIANVANGTAKTDAVNKGQLDAVSTVANAANTTANTANTTANAANTTANTANTTANAANSTANTANTTANAANTTANTANTTANAANATANTANTTANTANTTANAANTTANSALNKVNKGWNINTDKVEGGNVEGSNSTNVQMGDTVKVIAGKNLNITQSGKDITLSVNDSPNFTSITTSNGATIGGDLTVNGTTTTKDLNVTNNTNIEKNLTVKGDSTVKGNSTVEGTTTTKDLNVTNNANIEKDLTVKGNSTVNGNSAVNGTTTTKDLNVTNSANIEKDLTVKGNSTVNGTTTTKDLNVTNNANIEKDLTVKGNSTVNGTTTTKDLNVTDTATIKDLNVTNNATVNNLTSTNGTITNLNSTNSTITNLTSENGTFSNKLTSTGETVLSGNTTVGGQDKTFTVANGTKVDMG
ncbi:hypothetical protein BKK56_10575, partial [Rodentibacter genomosp. 2]|uniref:ESPR-type extended signal peptide-containing protein n=1 Tax=Rodentibacter genomosp. 2 TaxID=1908266 RepID=UPI000984495A